MKANVIHVSGKRKSSIARATIKPGKGIVRINRIKLDILNQSLPKMKIMEPLLLAGNTVASVNIDVNVKGGGFMSQAEASRLVIARALSQFDKKLEKTFLEYDRHLLVADVRRKETRKPNRHGKARSHVQKSYR